MQGAVAARDMRKRSVAKEHRVLDRKVNPGRCEPAVLDFDPCEEAVNVSTLTSVLGAGVRGASSRPSAQVKVRGERDGR
jgi:hypothetical protein